MTASSSRKSIRRMLLIAWLIPAALAITLSVGAFLGLGWIEYRNSIQRIAFDAAEKSRVIARRLAAEVLIGKQGAVESVSRTLEQEFGVQDIRLEKKPLNCRSQAPFEEGMCVERKGNLLEISRALPFVQDPQKIRMSIAAPSYRASLNFQLLAWSTIPVILLLGLGAFLQRRILKREIIEPIESLASNSALRQEAPVHWSEEIAELSQNLKEAFRQRDHAIVGQIAGGAIHDIKTLLHSTLTAADLVREQAADSPKRASRLEFLYRACTTNLPKIRAIVDTVLDGSRDIQIQPKSEDLQRAIHNAVEAHQEQAKRRGVEIELDAPQSPVEFAHDPVQMERALSNLIRNGIEAFDESHSSQPDRRVRIKIARPDQTRVELTVEDSGPGLPFPPEEALSSVRTTKVHGTGLGLLVTRKIIEAHRGTLRAGRSEALNGARFSIEFESAGNTK